MLLWYDGDQAGSYKQSCRKLGQRLSQEDLEAEAEARQGYKVRDPVSRT